MPVLVPIPIALFIGQRFAVSLGLVFTIYWAGFTKLNPFNFRKPTWENPIKRSRFLPLALCILISASMNGCGKSKQEIEALAAQESALALKKQEDAITASFQAQTAQHLKDPAAAQFAKVRMNTAKTALCGQVNAKNSYGGYVGFRDFITTEKGSFIKPDACGTTSVVDRPPDEASACIKYMMATRNDNTCD